MRRNTRPLAIAAAVTLLIGPAGCGRVGGASAPAMPTDALDHAIGDVIGDPTTCVIIAQRATRKVVYTYGEPYNCQRTLPACDRPGLSSAKAALAFADSADGRGASCPTSADGSRTVGWAEGRVASTKGDWIYSAVMEGEAALPGQEMSARLADAFAHAGL